MYREQRIRDPIHNLIKFSLKDEDKMLWDILQTPALQRLRRIKQLGFSEFVYPGATHTRFSHSLGAMQMARRMLDVFERNEILGDQANRDFDRQATLAAALLHDIGHGPYSHVFEEVSRSIGLGIDHEDYTRELISTDPIRSILSLRGIADSVTRFFEQEPGTTPYTAIISSQMDCDRLDFICRDIYFTGLRSENIDLEWLFDSLGIDLVSADPGSGIEAYTFIVKQKGIGVVEGFVSSYSKMYKSVYFHKTTRAIQYMVQDLLLMILNSDAARAALGQDNAIIRYFYQGSEDRVTRYTSLDDSTILALIHIVADGPFGSASLLARRILNRDIYRCLELPTDSSGQPLRTKAKIFFERLRDSNIPYIQDIPTPKGYKQFDVVGEGFLNNILVEKDGEYFPLGTVSPRVRSIDHSSVRVYFRSVSDRDKAKAFLQSE